jgi:hypothetical protein
MKEEMRGKVEWRRTKMNLRRQLGQIIDSKLTTS